MSTKRLETFLARLLVDAGFRAEFLRDPRRIAAESGIEGDEQEALVSIDRPGLLLAARSLTAKRNARSSATVGVFQRAKKLWRRILRS